MGARFFRVGADELTTVVPSRSDRVPTRAARIRRDRAIAARLDQAAGLVVDRRGYDRNRLPLLRGVLTQANGFWISDSGSRDAEGVPEPRRRRQRRLLQ